ncbi:MAG: chromosomal replication initiator protein DnaA [Candidatus Nealsonbacteria bacterium]|nr:chromosomal replication initiator protein DnaA [Candidatus Nealsonbacteria bacterium]
MMSNEELWQAVIAQIQLNISSANFATWFKNTNILSFNEGGVIVSVPNSFTKEWLENKYNKIIFKTLREIDPKIKDIKYTITKGGLKITKKTSEILEQINQLELLETGLNKETNLNPRYTFENFIVGPFNELPYAAATALCQNPGSVYNPLFVYGGVGLGKTHILQAIGNEIIKNFPDKKIKYIPSEKFISGIINAIKNREAENFKSKFKAIDVLIVDDVQFLAGKEKTQEEFFHIFNALYQKNNQIVISSDRSPKNIPALTERLRSRFEGGMIVDIGIPDLETRVVILKTKAQEKKVEFSEEIYHYIASQIQKNIRELEGCLNRLIIHQKLNKTPLDLELTKVILKNITLSSSKTASPKKIIQTVAEFYDLKEKDLLVSTRRKEIVFPRQIAMYLLRTENNYSYPFIGKKFSGKDHTTVIYSFEKISREIEKNEKLEEEINLIKQRIYSP